MVLRLGPFLRIAERLTKPIGYIVDNWLLWDIRHYTMYTLTISICVFSLLTHFDVRVGVHTFVRPLQTDSIKCVSHYAIS